MLLVCMLACLWFAARREPPFSVTTVTSRARLWYARGECRLRLYHAVSAVCSLLVRECGARCFRDRSAGLASARAHGLAHCVRGVRCAASL
jgi:hypothetical protein